MTAAERGLYISALCWEWLEGDLPDDVARLAFLLRLRPRDVAQAWPTVRQRFTARENGRLYHERLESDRAKAAERLTRWRESGSRGGRAKASREASGSDDDDEDGNSRQPVGTLEAGLEAPSTIKQASKSIQVSNNNKACGADAVAGFSPRERRGDDDEETLLALLAEQGVSPTAKVRSLVRRFPERVRPQIEMHAWRRGLKDKSATLITAINDDWARPEGMRIGQNDLLSDPNRAWQYFSREEFEARFPGHRYGPGDGTECYRPARDVLAESAARERRLLDEERSQSPFDGKAFGT